jgi:hypothetical protein
LANLSSPAQRLKNPPPFFIPGCGLSGNLARIRLRFKNNQELSRFAIRRIFQDSRIHARLWVTLNHLWQSRRRCSLMTACLRKQDCKNERYIQDGWNQ